MIFDHNSFRRRNFKPFGDTLWTSTGFQKRDNFDGSTYDSESNLQMLGFHNYDTETGRFTTPDLLWSAFPSQTPYQYVYHQWYDAVGGRGNAGNWGLQYYDPGNYYAPIRQNGKKK